MYLNAENQFFGIAKKRPIVSVFESAKFGIIEAGFSSFTVFCRLIADCLDFDADWLKSRFYGLWQNGDRLTNVICVLRGNFVINTRLDLFSGHLRFDRTDVVENPSPDLSYPINFQNPLI